MLLSLLDPPFWCLKYNVILVRICLAELLCSVVIFYPYFPATMIIAPVTVFFQHFFQVSKHAAPVRDVFMSFITELLLDCVSTAIVAVELESVVHHRSSIKRAFSETDKPLYSKFCGKVAIHHISRPFVFQSLAFFT